MTTKVLFHIESLSKIFEYSQLDRQTTETFCHCVGSQFQNMKISPHFCAKRGKSEHKFVHWNNFESCPSTSKKYLKEKPFTFQQDGALSHKSKKTLWCQATFPVLERRFGCLCHPTSTQWNFMFSSFWRLMPAPLIMPLLRLSCALLKKNMQKYHKKPCRRILQ